MLRILQVYPALNDACRVVSRHRKPVLGYFLLVMIAVAIATAVTPEEFRSESKLLLRLGRENVGVDATATMGQGGVTVSPPSSREDEINSVVEMLQSRLLRERVIDAFGPDAILSRRSSAFPGATRVQHAPAIAAPNRATVLANDGTRADVSVPVAGGGLLIGPRPKPIAATWLERLSLGAPTQTRERAMMHFARRLTVSAPRRSTVISIEYDAASPQLAQAIVQKIVDLYLDQHVRLYRTQGSRDFFAAQTEELREHLTQAEQQLRALKNATGITSIADQRRILVERIGELEDEALRAESQLAVSQAEAGEISSRLQRIPEMLETERASGLANEAADGMRQQLYALQLKEQELLSKYTTEVPAVREIQRQVREAREILDGEEARRTQVTSARNPTYEQLNLSFLTARTNIAALGAKASAVRRQLRIAKSGLVTLNENEMHLTQAQRELELQEAKYRRYSESLEQARVDQALELQRISNISVVQPATLEERPIRPRKGLNLAIGLLVALAGSFALAFVAEQAERARP